MYFFLLRSALVLYFFFFFQAEDGIRDVAVTGVQTCALPICVRVRQWRRERYQAVVHGAIGALEHLNLLVDTGSIPSMVDRRVTKKLGVDVQESEIVAVAFGQKSRVLTTVLPNVGLSPLRAESVTAGVGDLSFLNGVDAIIGLDVLTRSSFSIDYETRQVAFGPLVPREPTVQLEGTPPFLTVRLALAGRPI